MNPTMKVNDNKEEIHLWHEWKRGDENVLEYKYFRNIFLKYYIKKKLRIKQIHKHF